VHVKLFALLILLLPPSLKDMRMIVKGHMNLRKQRKDKDVDMHDVDTPDVSETGQKKGVGKDVESEDEGMAVDGPSNIQSQLEVQVNE
jgi:hypothetical protein